MHTKNLARHYDTLSVRERFPLLLAARLRGDRVEADHLTRSAPSSVYQVPDYRGLAEVLGELSWLHRVRLLDAAALLWRVDSLRESNLRRSRRGEEREQRDIRLVLLLRLQAYLFLVERQAWQRFCGELHLDPEALIHDLPGGDTVAGAEESARTLAFSVDEAIEAARLRGGEEAVVITVESVLADYRAALQAQEGRWG